MEKKETRREFLKKLGILKGALVLGSTGLIETTERLVLAETRSAEKSSTKSSELPKRKLGHTGWNVSIIGLGGVFFSTKQKEERIKIVDRAIDLGINYIDTASSYEGGRSEEYLGEVMKRRRNEVFLATKTLQRTKEAARKEIDRSLKRLHVDHVDLLQIHSVGDDATLNQVLGPNGSLEAIVSAQKVGKIRFIGITGHRRPEVLVRALKSFRFDTLLIALSAADHGLYDLSAKLIPLAQKNGVAIIGMKAFAEGRLVEKIGVERCLRYTMSLPTATTIVGVGSLGELEEDVAVARNFVPMSKDEMVGLQKVTSVYANINVLWWKR